MSYTVFALSLDGDIEVVHASADDALDFAMLLGTRGCRAISIRTPGGGEYDVTTFFRLQREPSDPRVRAGAG